MKSNEEKGYKSNDSAFIREIEEDLEKNREKFRDPVVLGEMMYQILQERENTNRILKNILTKLDSIAEQRTVPAPKEEIVLPEIDEKIVSFVKRKGKATSEEVRRKFKYRGRNAASARLNRLCKMGILRKKQVGKKVFFFPK